MIEEFGFRFDDTLRFSLTKLKDHGYSFEDIQKEYGQYTMDIDYWDNVVSIHLNFEEELSQAKTKGEEELNKVLSKYSLNLLVKNSYPKLYENKNCFVVENSYGYFSQYDKLLYSLKDVLNQEHIKLVLIDL